MIYFSDKDDQTLAQGYVGQRIYGADLPMALKIEFAQADGDELARAFKILGRPEGHQRVYTFVGDAAREIAINWSRK